MEESCVIVFKLWAYMCIIPVNLLSRVNFMIVIKFIGDVKMEY